jgi:hypothetical protein
VAAEPFMEISSDKGFINPVTASFPMRNSMETLHTIESLFLVVVNRPLSWAQLKSIGTLNGASIGFSWSGFQEEFLPAIEQEFNIDATGTIYSLPFYVKFIIQDNMGILPLDQYINILQIKLTYL